MSETTITTNTTKSAHDLTADDQFTYEGATVTVAGTRSGDGSSADEDAGWVFVATTDERVIRFAADDVVEVTGASTADVSGNGAGELVKPDLTQCTYKTAAGRRCKLAPHGDDVKHRMVIRDAVKAPKTLSELRKEDAKTFGKFTLIREDIPATATVAREYHREVERDEDQKRVDADALTTYQKWTKGGKKTGTLEDLAPKFGSRYIVPAAAFDTVIQMLRRSVQAGTKTTGKKLSYRRTQHVSGNVIVNYMLTDDGAIKQPKKDDN